MEARILEYLNKHESIADSAAFAKELGEDHQAVVRRMKVYRSLMRLWYPDSVLFVRLER